LALLALGLPMALLALALRASVGRPVLFVQQRVGRAEVPFRLIKFRTMTEARDSRGDLLPDEARMTRLGRWLRRLRLDELPEFYSILRGDMSLVGPRPLPRSEFEGFGHVLAHRCRIRPGLTGWAQVSGNTALSDEQKMALDLWYVDHRSLLIDLKILIRTLGVVVIGEKRNLSAIERAMQHAERFDERSRFGAGGS
jgi:lipopolysaccharide/colanic/teichoic acid biosynthesis glycosyltransferase